MLNEITSSPLFGVVITIFAFQLGVWINRKTKLSVCNPLLIAVALIIAVLSVFKIPLENYYKGGDLITAFLAPATAVLALSIYSQIKVLKKNFLPIFLGCLAGSIVAMTSSVAFCKLFGLSDELAFSMMPKSVTTPIAMELSAQHGGIVAVTVAAVVVTGILGAIFSPFLIKVFHIKNPVAQGVAIGASSHGLGTTKAVEMGELQGAMSGIAIGISGIITVVLSLFVR